MGLLSNISVNLQKTFNFGADFCSSAKGLGLKSFGKISFNKSEEKSTNTKTTTSPISNNELVFKNPIQFINRFLTEETINRAIRLNPNISKILKENGLNVEYNLANVKSIAMSHLIPTTKKAQEAYISLGHTKDEINYTYLTQAALLHDIGKIFIPEAILNKKGRLTLKEKAIVNLHAKLGCEVLKTTSLNPKVARLTYEHHNIDGKITPNDENQVLTMADIFSALKEKRPYKKSLDNIQTIATMYDMATNKKAFNVRYMTYLKL